MKKIYKYTLNIQTTDLYMPLTAKILHIAAQGNDIQMWVEVDTDNMLAKRVFRAVGTGMEVPEGVYLGTVLQHPFVWHFYEV